MLADVYLTFPGEVAAGNVFGPDAFSLANGGLPCYKPSTHALQVRTHTANWQSARTPAKKVLPLVSLHEDPNSHNV